MGRRSTLTGERRPRLTSERVLAAALTLVDESGLDALTMRRLGEVLGVEAMSLYNHVAGKEGIVDGIVDLVLGEMEPISSEGDWDTAVRRCAISAHEVLLRHPWVCSLVMIPTLGRGVQGARLRYIDSMLRRFREAGFSADLAFRAYHAVDSHILGFTMWEIGHTSMGGDEPEIVETLLAEVMSGRYPFLVEHAEQHMVDRSGEQSEFEFGLELVLDGLRRMKATETGHKRRPKSKKG